MLQKSLDLAVEINYMLFIWAPLFIYSYNLVTVQEEGFAALSGSPPVIYITTTTYLEVAQYVCIQLGLPKSSVRYVRCFYLPFFLLRETAPWFHVLHSLLLGIDRVRARQ